LSDFLVLAFLNGGRNALGGVSESGRELEKVSDASVALAAARGDGERDVGRGGGQVLGHRGDDRDAFRGVVGLGALRDSSEDLNHCVGDGFAGERDVVDAAIGGSEASLPRELGDNGDVTVVVSAARSGDVLLVVVKLGGILLVMLVVVVLRTKDHGGEENQRNGEEERSEESLGHFFFFFGFCFVFQKMKGLLIFLFFILKNVVTFLLYFQFYNKRKEKKS
jgi:hypothetical protein